MTRVVVIVVVVIDEARSSYGAPILIFPRPITIQSIKRRVRGGRAGEGTTCRSHLATGICMAEIREGYQSRAYTR